VMVFGMFILFISSTAITLFSLSWHFLYEWSECHDGGESLSFVQN